MFDFIQIPDVQDVFNDLHQSLADTVLSLNSIYGVLFLIVAIGLVVKFAKNVHDCISWWLGLVLFLEIMHVLAFNTQLGSWVPVVKVVFKYDVLMMFAQMCVGTKVSEFLVLLQAYITTIIGGAFATIFKLCGMLFKFLFSQIGQDVGI